MSVPPMRNIHSGGPAMEQGLPLPQISFLSTMHACNALGVHTIPPGFAGGLLERFPPKVATISTDQSYAQVAGCQPKRDRHSRFPGGNGTGARHRRGLHL